MRRWRSRIVLSRSMPLSRRARVAAWMASAVALVAVAIPLAFAWWISGFVLHPPWEREAGDVAAGPVADPQTRHGLAFEDVEFETRAGVRLRGGWVPGPTSRAPGIVGVHGKGGSRYAYLGILPALHAAGYSVLAYDSRAHGASDDPGAGAAFAGGWRDVLAAARYLREAREVGRVAAMGHSQGATNVLLAGALAGAEDFDPGGRRLDAVLASAGGTNLYDLLRSTDSLAWLPDWEIDLITRVALLRMGSVRQAVFNPTAGPGEVVGLISPTPLFILHGDSDRTVPVDQAHTLYTRAGEPKALWIAPETGHDTWSHPDYTRRVVAFLDDHLNE